MTQQQPSIVRRNWILRSLALAGVAILVAACTQDFGQFFVDGGEGGSGGTGSGTTTTSTGPGGSGGSSTGVGGSPSGTPGGTPAGTPGGTPTGAGGSPPMCDDEPTPVGGDCPAFCTNGCENNLCQINCNNAPGAACDGEITCPAGFECHVLCDSAGDCDTLMSAVICPDTYACYVKCTGSNACSDITVTAGTGTTTVDCGGGGDNCLNAQVTCGATSGTCNINCEGSEPAVTCNSSCPCDTCP